MRTCVGAALRCIGPYALAALLGAAAPHAASAQEDGFGRDIPLSAAARQIVPAGYKVEMGKGVDGASNVTWTKPGDWRKKLDDAAQSGGYAVSMSGKTIRIERKGGAAIADVVQKAPDDADDAPRPAAHRSPAKPASADPAPRREPRPRHVEARRAEPARHVVRVAHRAEPVDRADVETEPAAAGPTVSASGFVLVPKRAERVAAAEPPAGGDEGWKPVSRKRAEPAAPAAPVGFIAQSGENLSTVLQDWAAREGWRVEWKSEYQYKLTASAKYQGGFMEASTELLRSMSEARPQPTAEFFKGNKVLVIDNGSRDETAASAE